MQKSPAVPFSKQETKAKHFVFLTISFLAVCWTIAVQQTARTEIVEIL